MKPVVLLLLACPYDQSVGCRVQTLVNCRTPLTDMIGGESRRGRTYPRALGCVRACPRVIHTNVMNRCSFFISVSFFVHYHTLWVTSHATRFPESSTIV
ncbi:hypothetical protein P691DRAFT_141255 [Macrolepiota fuliginosa MF-IS2]|uniref:Secreted protein n=1 Tax=Macrolepiota fuliginosa MF-IS2 TaxID=1400762 RepID=A0A9P6C2X0_9AGAR|nr:hypothetical protein P691DRAFT_141255 [Macrolepiota fuliginosa MF-IS2]